VKQKVLKAAEMDYSKQDSEALRQEMIELRNAALEQGDLEWSVKLSHTVAWMAVAIEEIYAP
jgi:hypothetical protein